jgi:hypothetical protein
MKFRILGDELSGRAMSRPVPRVQLKAHSSKLIVDFIGSL